MSHLRKPINNGEDDCVTILLGRLEGIHFYDELELRVRLTEDLGGGEVLTEFQECSFCLRGPIEWCDGGGESGERCCQMTEVAEKNWQTLKKTL